MKKFIALILILACTLAFVSCSRAAAKGGALLKEGTVKRITVTSLPEQYNYSFRGNAAQRIIDYVSGLDLIADFSENPDEYKGGAWVISLEYENGDVLTIYHRDNMFIRVENGPWYKMTYEEASAFDALLK